MTRLVPCCRGLAALARIGAVSTRVRVNTLFSCQRGRRVNMGFTVMTHPCVTAALPVSPRLARQHGPTRGDARVCHHSKAHMLTRRARQHIPIRADAAPRWHAASRADAPCQSANTHQHPPNPYIVRSMHSGLTIYTNTKI